MKKKSIIKIIIFSFIGIIITCAVLIYFLIKSNISFDNINNDDSYYQEATTNTTKSGTIHGGNGRRL